MITLTYPQGTALDKSITLPGSKYLANRLLILAALAESNSSFDNMPINEDIETSIEGLTQLGASFDRQDNILYCQGFKQYQKVENNQLYSSHSGSFSRFVAPVLALFEQDITLTGSDKMNTRPMAELFRALESLGAVITSENQNLATTLPATISGSISGSTSGATSISTVEMSGATSSQYISALLMIAGKLQQPLDIKLTTEPVSKPYLQMTIELLSRFGVTVKTDQQLRHFQIAANQPYQGIDYQVESDPSSASYFLAAAAISSGHICISNFHPQKSLQGEAQFAKVLESMGCKIWQDEDGFHCQGPEKLSAVKVDMVDMPDVVQTLAVVAMYAEGTTVINNIANLAFKESNRIEDTATEIRKTGIVVSTTEDSLAIEGGMPTAAVLDTYDDHRMAMSLALMAFKTEGVQMRDSGVVGKSFPTYWRYLEQLGYVIN